MKVLDIVKMIDHYCCIVIDDRGGIYEYEDATHVDSIWFERSPISLEILSPIETNFPDRCGLRITL